MKDKKYFEELLGRNKIEQLIIEWLEALRQYEQNDLHGSVLLLLTRHRRNEEKSRQNSISENDYNLESNKLINSIKDYLKEFEYLDLNGRFGKRENRQDKLQFQAIPESYKNNISMTFDSKLNLIYKGLSLRPERRAHFEQLLNELNIPFHNNDISEFEEEFIKSGFVKVTAKSKDGIEIFLTQKGLDSLNSSPKVPSSKPSIVFENYHNSIVNKGANISQVGTFDNKNTESTPTQSPKSNSPTKTIQKWQLFIAIFAVLVAITLALLKKNGIL